MSKESKKESLVTSKVVAPLITAAVISLVATVIPGGWKWVFAKCRIFWLWFIGPVTIPIWLLVLLSLIALILLVGLVVLIYAGTRKAQNDTAAHYTEDVLFGIRWRWSYGQHGIYGLYAFCPHCDLQVYARPGSVYRAVDAVVYYCDDCRAELHHFDVDQDEVENLVKRKIQQKIRKGMSETQPA